MITDLKCTRVLVTGISGFIGSHLARALVKRGVEVHGMVRPGSSLWRIKDIEGRIQLHSADLTDSKAVSHVVSGVKPQKLFHLAACVDVSRSLAVMEEMVRVNVQGTLTLVNAAAEAGFDCFINSGTCEEYGDNPVPFREDQLPNPVSPYSAAKVASTVFCQMLHKTKGLPIITLRPFLTYGPDQENDMLIPWLIKSAARGETLKMTEGKQTREFNYVEDIVDGFIRASVCPGAVGEVINIGNGREYAIREVAEMVLRLMKSRSQPEFGALSYRPGETMHFYCDNTKAREILGWQAKVGLDDGLKKTIDWFQKHHQENRT
ncbi:MAG: SDR family NAD(P)-dependent oxidoreductase [Dehalococcoidales bacterium]|nr:SDR family NAD(P)-dependent oxidoreductase [Dehalococcoidales bacterium]